MHAAAIIAASGQGRRMGSPVRKQYLMLDGLPVLARTVNAFLEHGGISQVVLVVPQGETGQVRKILKPFLSLDSLTLVEGGRRRQDSVFNGLQAVDRVAELICIHDGARPLITVKLIAAVLEAAVQWGAAVPVVPVTDTLKEITVDGLIKRTISRDCLHRAQTPQVFRQELIREAYRKAALLGIEATDDAYLLELLGQTVFTVAGDYANIKITCPEDLTVAAALLKEGR
ncbi:MAG: 2-C-methyl-D-erythritol 4-phosphate cytidylyltransferase [Bacillota bacterium]